MNGAHLHLLLNHFPMLGLIFSTLIVLVSLIRKNQEFLKVGLMMAVASGILTIPTFLTGEPAETVVTNTPGFSSKAYIHEHELAADYAIWTMEITALLSLAGLYLLYKENQVPKALLGTIVFAHLFTLTVVARTNYLGGNITHIEIRDGAEPPPAH